MDQGRGDDQLQEGRRALEAARWDSARAAFEAALDAEDTPEARDGLGQALWFLGSVEEGIAAREHAFEDYARGGSCDRAARVAVWISHQYLISGRASAARGWLSRAERALEGIGRCEGQGWVAGERRSARAAARTGCGCSRRRWRPPRRAESATSTRSARPTAT